MTLPKHHGPATNNVQRYDFYRLGPTEFRTLMKETRTSTRDFMFLTGRHNALVATYLGEGANRDDQRPSMGDIMLLELIKRQPDLRETMFEIANSYSLGRRLSAEFSERKR